MANIGVHGKPATLHLEKLWTRDVTITTGLVDAYTTPTLIRLLAGGQLRTNALVTQRFALDDMIAAYDMFARADETGALKVVLTSAAPGSTQRCLRSRAQLPDGVLEVRVRSGAASTIATSRSRAISA